MKKSKQDQSLHSAAPCLIIVPKTASGKHFYVYCDSWLCSGLDHKLVKQIKRPSQRAEAGIAKSRCLGLVGHYGQQLLDRDSESVCSDPGLLKYMQREQVCFSSLLVPAWAMSMRGLIACKRFWSTYLA